jgi:hypothetical protein
MKIISVLAICVALCQNALSQNTKQLTAYSLARQLVALERKIDSKEKLTQAEREDSIPKLIGSLMWYADLQDEQFSEQRNSLETKVLGADYARLRDCYYKLMTHLYNLDAIFEMKEDVLTSKLRLSDGNETLNSQEHMVLNSMKRYWQASRDTISLNKQLRDGQVKLLSLVHTREMEEKNLTVFLDSVQNLTTLPDSSNVVDLSPEMKSFKSAVAQETNVRNNIQSIENKIENARTQVGKIKEELITSLTASAVEPQVQKIFEVILGVSTKDLYANIVKQNKSVTEATIQYNAQVEKKAEQAEAQQYSLKLPTEAQIIDAIAIYLANRVKQESVMWFFETIQKNAKHYELLKTFFPNTITLLLSNEVYEIPNLGTQWRYALSKDFVTMPKNVLNSSWFINLYKKISSDKTVEAREFLMAAFEVGDMLSKKLSYREMVKQMYLQLNANKHRFETKDNIVTPELIFGILYAVNEECLVFNEEEKRFQLMQYEDIRTAGIDELEILVSLLDMKYGHTFAPIWKRAVNNNFVGRFLDSKEDAEAFRQWFGRIEIGIDQFNKIQKSVATIKEDLNHEKSSEVIYSIFNLWENVNQLMTLVIPDELIKNPKLQLIAQKSGYYKKAMEQAFEIYHQISLKNYAGSVNSTIALVESLIYQNNSFTVSTKDFEAMFGDLKSLRTRWTDKIPESIVIKQNDQRAAVMFAEDRHAINLVRKLGGFLNDVMLATDSKTLSKVVQSYALPPGSYKRKRNSWWSVDLNAYVGGFVGSEDAFKKRLQQPSLRNSGAIYGVTAPIGISISKTMGKSIGALDTLTEDYIRNPDKLRVGRKRLWYRSVSTFTLSFSLVDLGAVVAYRFNNATAKVLPQDVKWSQVFSPGVKFGYGIPGTPLMIAAGYQYTPQLRRLDDGEPDAEQYNTNRVFGSILFDLPLINIWQRSHYGSAYNRKL